MGLAFSALVQMEPQKFQAELSVWQPYLRERKHKLDSCAILNVETSLFHCRKQAVLNTAPSVNFKQLQRMQDRIGRGVQSTANNVTLGPGPEPMHVC